MLEFGLRCVVYAAAALPAPDQLRCQVEGAIAQRKSELEARGNELKGAQQKVKRAPLALFMNVLTVLLVSSSMAAACDANLLFFVCQMDPQGAWYDTCRLPQPKAASRR